MHRIKYLVLGITILSLLGIQKLPGESKEKINRVADSAEEICPLMVGDEVPNISLTTASGEPFHLNSALSRQPTLLIFYRGGWCPFCNMHLSELQNIRDDLAELGYQILAISMDRPRELRESRGKHQLHYTLLSDSAAVAARAFGLAYRVKDTKVKQLKKGDMNIEKASGKSHHILPVPAAYIIGTDGKIRFEYTNPNYKVRVNAEVVLAAARVWQE